MISGNKQGKIPDLIKEIIGQRMSLKTTASLDNGSVIETEITIPRDSVVIDNTEILCDVPRIGAVNDHKKEKNKTFSFGGWKNDFQKG